MTNKQIERKRLDSLIEKIRVGLKNKSSESLLNELNEILELDYEVRVANIPFIAAMRTELTNRGIEYE